MPTVSGVWKWNDIPVIPSTDINQNINAQSGSLTDISEVRLDSSGFNRGIHYVHGSNDAIVFMGSTSTWGDESYKTIDFGEIEQEVSQDFYNYLTINATQQEEPTMAKVKGVWVWNDGDNIAEGDYNVSVNFTSNGQSYSSMVLSYGYDGQPFDPARVDFSIKYDSTEVLFATYPYQGSWRNQAYRTVDFGSTEQEVSEDFYNYLIQNAKKGGGNMPDSIKKYQIQQKQEDGMLTLHPETEASIVIYDGTGAGLTATNVQDAVDELKTLVNDITGGGVVTGVKGDSEESYRQGNVNITKANIGLGNVTNDAQIPLSQKGAASGVATLDASTKVPIAQIPTIPASNIGDLSATYIPVTQKGAASGVATLGTDSKIPASQLPDLSATYIPVSQKGSNSGVATLGSDGKVPASQLPSYVDDVIEGYYYNGQFYSDAAHQNQITPEEGKIYVDLSTNKTYRWGGSTYAPLDAGLALGETAGTAYEGSKGKQNADNIAAIIAGTQKVGNATNADNATNATHATSADSATEADHATSADSATTAGTATNAGNVTTSINGHALTEIFEENGTTVKEATHATSANSATNATNATNATTATTAGKLTTARTIGLSGDVVGSASFDGSANATISATLAASGVTAGTYSVVTVDAKGRVTTGGQIVEVGTTGQSAPTAALAVGGIFFKEI